MIPQTGVAAFRRDGFLSVPGFFDPATTAEIVRWVDEIETWPETPGAHMMYFEDSLRVPGQRLLNRVENFVPYHAGFSQMLAGAGLRESVGDLFGEPSVLFKEKINFKLPGGNGFEAHQDAQAGWDDYVGLCITAMVTIDETTVANGCLEMGRWRHRCELIGEMWRPLQPEDLLEVEFFSCPTKPGDVVFFDSYVPHRSAPNLTDQPRRVLYVTYNAASDGDQRERYYADKRRSYPPDCEREPGKVYEYRV